MPFTKGISGNPAGRPLGAKTKRTSEIKALVQEFVSSNLETLQADFDALEPKDRLAFIEKLLKFVIPTQSANEINVNALSESELDTLCNSLLSKLNADSDETPE